MSFCKYLSVISTDKWVYYNDLTHGSTHRTKDNSYNVVDTVMDTCTNHIDAYFSRVKTHLNYVTKSSMDMKCSRVDVYMYRDMYRFTA